MKTIFRVTIVSLMISLMAMSAFAKRALADTSPDEMHISCTKPNPDHQKGLHRPKGDSNHWKFKIVLDGNAHFVKEQGPFWEFEGIDGNDPDWGMLIPSSPYKLTNAWEILDAPNLGAECAAVSTLMKQVLEILGLPGAEVKYIYARHASWEGLAQSNATGNEFGADGFDYVRNLPYVQVLVMYNGYKGYDYFEACCYFENKYWMGNLAESRSIATGVLAKMTGYPQVNQGLDQVHQSYVRKYAEGVKLGEETADGISFPSGPAPTY